MVTDRLATACLLALLCALYPRQAPLPLFLLALDVASHWAQVAATAAAGSASHKEEGAASTSKIVRAYYSSRLFMGSCCVSCEVLYLALYSLRARRDGGGGGAGRGGAGPPRVPLPGLLGRAAAGVVNGVAAALSESAPLVGGGASRLGRRFLSPLQLPSRTPWSPPAHVPAALVFALMSLPGFAIKQAINWRQLRTAFEELARHDVEVSRRARKAAKRG
jgi:CDP-diacylglycerol--inositol 3-phosphatidyltransferase